jgi:5-methylcytosine-specific restriction endonuclease McrA
MFKRVIGQIFGQWKAISFSEDKKYHVVCECQCDSKTIRTVRDSTLRRGKSTSCGCYRKEMLSERKGIPKKFEDLTGQQFDRWTVKGFSHREIRGAYTIIFWNVQCECPNRTIHKVGGPTLKRGLSRSCGCLNHDKRSDLSNMVFGRLTALSIDETKTNDGHVKWICRCSCGKTTTVASSHLTRGITVSCGCARADGSVLRPAQVREAKNKNSKQRKKNDVHFNLNRKMSAGIRQALKLNNVDKAGVGWKKIVGYDAASLKDHLEHTMPEGYSWNDYLSGKLQIDHIVPLSVFDYHASSDSFNQAWSLENLRLLETKENLKKGSRLDFPEQASLLFKFGFMSSP